MRVDKCHWTYEGGRFALTACGSNLYLSKTLSVNENKCMDFYNGSKCPCCGKEILINNKSYNCLKEVDYVYKSTESREIIQGGVHGIR